MTTRHTHETVKTRIARKATEMQEVEMISMPKEWATREQLVWLGFNNKLEVIMSALDDVKKMNKDYLTQIDQAVTTISEKLQLQIDSLTGENTTLKDNLQKANDELNSISQFAQDTITVLESDDPAAPVDPIVVEPVPEVAPEPVVVSDAPATDDATVTDPPPASDDANPVDPTA